MTNDITTKAQAEPLSPNFPVTWDDPTAADLFWIFDAVHFPAPVKPLDFMLLLKGMEAGINHAAQVYEMGFSDTYRHINTYVYDGAAYLIDSPDVMAARMDRCLQKLDTAAMTLEQRWTKEWLPEIQTHLAYWDSYDLKQASLAALREHLDETVRRWSRLWEIHFLLFYPILLSLSNFEEMAQDLMADGNRFTIYDLLATEENKTTVSNRALWQLSRTALTYPTVKQVLAEQSAEHVVTALQQSADGEAFLQAMTAYLQSYGYRNDQLSLSAPTWIEEPTSLIRNLQDYITQPDRDLLAELDAVAAQRAARLAATRTALEGYPSPVVVEFERQFQAAQVSYRLSEDHNFWIEGRGLYCVRQVCLALGQRLVEAHVITTLEDLFYLTVDEIRAAATTATSFSLQEQVYQRRQNEAHFAKCAPPPFLGTPPPEDIPSDDPLSRAFAKFFSPPPPQAVTSEILQGYAGSPGIVQGPARVIRSLTEAERIQPGDILVTTTTTPTWTALFGSIAAIVTDSGGILSHSAIVAREHGVPAVVGVGVATTTIIDGQWLEVDGNQGVVRLCST